jgi:hypothetical protein
VLSLITLLLGATIPAAAQSAAPAASPPVAASAEVPPEARSTLPPDFPWDTFDTVWQALQAELAALVPGGRQVIAAESGHYVQLQQPEPVIATIQQVVEAVRDPSTWTPPAVSPATATPTAWTTPLTRARARAGGHASAPRPLWTEPETCFWRDRLPTN